MQHDGAVVRRALARGGHSVLLCAGVSLVLCLPSAVAAQQERPASDGPRAPSPLDLDVAFGGVSRDVSYRDDLTGLQTYAIKFPPAFAASGRWYPAAHVEDSALAHLGVELSARFAFGLDSQLEAGSDSLPTRARDLGAGVRARLPIGPHEAALMLGYAVHGFQIEGQDPSAPTPSIDYQVLRVGAEGHFALSSAIGLSALVAWLPIIGFGELERWFPRASGYGLELGARLIHPLSASFELSLGGSIRRYAVSMNSELVDAERGHPIAGGLIDQYVCAHVGMRWSMPGAP